jgi:glycosyltransferase involved in cell wall biosynthesis
VRVLFVHNRYLQNAGGEDTTVEAEIRLLSDKGHTVEAVYFNNDSFGGSLLSKVKAGLRTIYNSDSKQLLKEVIGTFEPDIIHVHNFYFQASPAVFDAASECKVPIVLTVHNFRLVCVNALLLRNNRVCEDCIHSFLAWKGILHKCYHNSTVDSTMVALISASHKVKQTWTKKINRYITPSAFMRNKLLHSSLQLKEEGKIAVKRNFINDPGTGDISERGDYYLFVGRLSEEKGADFLLRSFSALKNEKLLVVGDGPQKEALINTYGQQPNITFLGKKDRSEVLRLLKHCRALLFPSIWYEGLPVTIIEAFATGTPVIASKLGAMEEMIVAGNNGLFFEKENAAELAAAITTMNQLISERNDSLYKGARQTYINYYNPDVCYEEVIKIYTSAIEENRNRLKKQ